ncbi:hypothetical protein IQ268_17405 [Oculatella sp. LEGE 06141]|nr:hypothetical protein [Oculatella sp. LEGE 06141]MBE9180342.1 hypothetical protein [Oculatella sp. LEGE 06141]
MFESILTAVPPDLTFPLSGCDRQLERQVLRILTGESQPTGYFNVFHHPI